MATEDNNEWWLTTPDINLLAPFKHSPIEKMLTHLKMAGLAQRIWNNSANKNY